MARLTAVGTIRRVTPPWLRRIVGAQVMEGIASVLDDVAERFVEGVKLRFPGVPPRAIDPKALALTGRERRIRRGPGETAASYADRLLPWWDDHRTRGGPYALLLQMRAFLLAWLPVRMDVVYHSGTRRWIDEDGVITRDAITWGADGSDLWAQVWVFYHLPDLIPVDGETLVTSDGEAIVTSGGDELVTTASISPGAITPAEEEIFLAIPREWSAAHVAYTHVVLLYSTARLWNYPQPVPTWTAWGASGATWGGPSPVILTIEG